MALPNEVLNEKRNYRLSARERKYVQPVVQVILSCLSPKPSAKPILRLACSCATRGRTPYSSLQSISSSSFADGVSAFLTCSWTRRDRVDKAVGLKTKQ